MSALAARLVQAVVGRMVPGDVPAAIDAWKVRQAAWDAYLDSLDSDAEQVAA